MLIGLRRLAAALVVAGIGSLALTAQSVPVTGPDVPGAIAYDQRILALMQTWGVPGVAIAVTKGGKLVLARGYGWADRENQTPVQPNSLFRIASLTKPFTSAAILRLVREGRVSLDNNFLDVLTTYQLPRNGDVRLRQVTIRELLQHGGGWDRTVSFDPMFASTSIANSLGVPPPAECSTIITYMMGQRLDFDPGTKYAYSNFGHCILGRVIEQVAGMPFEDYVRANVLASMGIAAMQVGKSLVRAPGEVKYYDYPGAPLAASVFPTVGPLVPWPYGGFYLEAMDSHGAWLASATDLARFLTALDGQRGTAFFSPAEIAQIMGRPAIPGYTTTRSWYGMGWSVNTANNWWHTGSLPGTSTEFVHAANGYTWAILANTRPSNSSDFFTAIDQLMWDALGTGLQGSPTDLFAQFPSPDTVPPTVIINTPTSAATYTTTTSPITVSGRATDYIGVTTVSWANNRGGSGAATGTTAWSAANIPLQAGANLITITARDAAANFGTRTLTVTYTPTP